MIRKVFDKKKLNLDMAIWSVQQYNELSLDDEYFLKALHLVQLIDYKRREQGKFDGIQLKDFSFTKGLTNEND